MKLIAIAAVSEPHGIIGVDGRLPWNLREDLKRFRDHTIDHAVIMGRKTYESLGKALPFRLNIVISSTITDISDAVPVRTLDEAIEVAKHRAQDKAFIIGGAQLYKAALPRCDEALITRVDAPHLKAGTFFSGDFTGLRIQSCEWFYRNETNEYDMRFERWIRC